MNAPPPASDADAGLRDQVLAWHLRQGRDDWSAADAAEFQAWLDQDPGRQAAWTRWQGHWQALDAVPAEALSALRSRLAMDKARQTSAKNPTQVTRRRLLPALGLACVLAATCGSALLAWQHWQAQPIFVQSFRTERGQQVETRLPDGSRLRLDTATRLEVSYYRQRREVRLLDGQAFFNVQSDTHRPFTVQAGPVDITVVGTRFSVRHTPGQPGATDIRVAVEQGRVHVAHRSGESAAAEAGVDLTAGQQVTADGEGRLAPQTAVRSEDVAPWRSYRISFVDTPLDQALAEFERYGSTGLVLRGSDASALRLSGTFDPRDPQTFARVLPSALPVRLVPAGGQTEIVAR